MTEISDNIIEWVISFSAKYDTRSNELLIDNNSEESLIWKFKIRINLFSDKFPEVREINGDLERQLDLHIYPDWKFCLTHTLFERKYKYEWIKNIIEEFIIPFLYNQLYNHINWEFLWEYWHDHEWTFECINDWEINHNDYLWVMEQIKPYISQEHPKLFLYSKKEQIRMMQVLNLKSSKSIRGFTEFIDYYK